MVTSHCVQKKKNIGGEGIEKKKKEESPQEFIVSEMMRWKAGNQS